MQPINYLIIILTAAIWGNLYSAKLENVPTELIQPDGSRISVYFSGDEFYHYCHDQNGYGILKDHQNWYSYAVSENGKLVASTFKVGRDNPAEKNLTRQTGISKEEYLAKKSAWQVSDANVKAPHTGIINTLAIFIRFSDQTEFTTPRTGFNTSFNSTTVASLKSYYKEVSYNNLDITTHFLPICDLATNLSYCDSHQRGYFTPYSATNTIGYTSVKEARLREHTLIKNAVESISTQAAGLDFDMDDDGFADNLCIITRGDVDGWADVGLWPHTGVADSYNIQINGARIFNYEFQFENYINYRVLAHEMFHILGAPDLYHYTDNPINSVGSWDIMESGSGHMGAYMKYRYANQAWITDIPEITQSGSYTLKPIYRSQNNCYKIRSPYSDNEFFILEYRKKTGLLENSIPGSGLLVYRIYPDGDNAYSPPDQVYIFRPNGTTNNNGSINSAYFSQNINRTAINDYTTNPKSFLLDGSAGGLYINNIGTADSVITFNVVIPNCIITAPADSVIHAANQNIPVNVNAVSKGFTKVELYLDELLLTTLQNPPYNYNLSIPNAGKYLLTAKAYADNGIIDQDTKTLFISKDQPFVYFTAPFENQLITTQESIIVSLQAGFPGFSLTKAEIYLDNQLQTTLLTEPYATSINTPAIGTHTIKAKVYAGTVFGEAEIVFSVGQLSLQESFEGIWPPLGWSVNTPTYGWYRTDKKARTGNYSAAVRHYHAQGVAILETPQINLGSNERIEFFWMDHDADITKVMGMDTTYFEIYADNQWQQLTFNSAENFQTDFVKKDIDLAQFAGKTVKFRWRDVTDESVYTQGCVLDDIQVGNGWTSINAETNLSKDLQVSNYPNPFNNSTVISLNLPLAGQARLQIYNNKGEMVKEFYRHFANSGINNLIFNAAKFNSGVYYYRVKVGKYAKTGRMLLIK